MFSVGGDNGGYFTPLFYVFDLVTLSWTNSYDPSKAYAVPANLTSVIGGKYDGDLVPN
jgi:hypothetical protein